MATLGVIGAGGPASYSWAVRKTTSHIIAARIAHSPPPNITIVSATNVCAAFVDDMGVEDGVLVSGELSNEKAIS
jgi:hypothetical protein